MAHQMIKPFSFLHYLLAFIAFFFVGIIYAGIVEAGKGQMLAGGAIVLGYGVMGAFIGLVLSLISASKFSRKIIIRTNIVLAISIIVFWGYFYNNYQEKQKAKELKEPQFQKTKAIAPKSNQETAFLFTSEKINRESDKLSGLGMFSPNMSEKQPLYFYSNPNFEKAIDEHLPNDSITFKKTEHNSYDIATAPPWLVPDHLKLDYDMLYFNVESITQDYIEVIVNTISNQTAYVSRYAGNMQYWPDFLLHVNSVEFPNPEIAVIYVKPLHYAGVVNTPYSFMKPLNIKQHWMFVELLNNDFEAVGNGWIKWIENGKLLISYSLLS